MHDDLTILHAKPEQAFFGADYLFVGTSQSQLLGLKGLSLPCKLKSRSRSINLHKTQGFFTLGYLTLSSMKVLAVKSWILFSGTNSYLIGRGKRGASAANVEQRVRGKRPD